MSTDTDQFCAVADLLPEALLLVSGDGAVLAVNRGAGRLGLTPAAVGRPLADLVTDPPAAVADYLRACARSRDLVFGGLTPRHGDPPTACRAEGAVYRPRADGAPAQVLIRLIPRPEAAGPFAELNRRIDALSQEVSRRRQTEADLRAQREWLRVTLESIGDAVIATDAAGNVTFMNAVAEQLTGWPQAEAAGRPLTDVFHIVNEDTRAPVDNPAAKVLRDGQVVGLANHTVLLARGGAERPIDDCAAPIRDADRNLVGTVLVFHDVTERRGLERELSRRAAKLEEADRRKDEFLAMLSHELRNPLAPLRTGLQILRMGGGLPPAVAPVREMLERQVDHLSRLVDDLLDVQRVTSGQVQLQRAAVALTAVLERAVETVRPLLDERRHELVLALPPRAVQVEADPVRLAQVFINLLENAARYTPPGGRIWLTSEDAGGERAVRVRDTGPGIAADVLPAIFDLFVQAQRPLARSEGGLGVGLTVARALVRMHGGRITAHSAGPGQGSEFVVRLPVLSAPPPPPPPPVAAPPPAAAAAKRRRVLVVDDNHDAATSLALLARLWGHEVHVAHDGLTALEVARTARPDAVLLDIGMPGLTGYEVAERLRREPGLERVLLVAITGYGQAEDRRRSQAAGFDHHFTKPVDLAQLQALLTAAPVA